MKISAVADPASYASRCPAGRCAWSNREMSPRSYRTALPAGPAAWRCGSRASRISALVGIAYWAAGVRSETGAGTPEAPRDTRARAGSESRAGSRSGRRKPMTDGAPVRAECWSPKNAVRGPPRSGGWALRAPRKMHVAVGRESERRAVGLPAPMYQPESAGGRGMGCRPRPGCGTCSCSSPTVRSGIQRWSGSRRGNRRSIGNRTGCNRTDRSRTGRSRRDRNRTDRSKTGRSRTDRRTSLCAGTTCRSSRIVDRTRFGN